MYPSSFLCLGPVWTFLYKKLGPIALSPIPCTCPSSVPMHVNKPSAIFGKAFSDSFACEIRMSSNVIWSLTMSLMFNCTEDTSKWFILNKIKCRYLRISNCNTSMDWSTSHKLKDCFRHFNWTFQHAGAFLIPYFICVLIGAIPMFVLEIAMGQYTSQGAVSCWNYFCPLFKG